MFYSNFTTTQSTTKITDFTFSLYANDPLLLIKFNELQKIFQELHFNKEAILEIAKDILIEAFDNGKEDIQISKTGEGELLLYRNVEGEYRNLIIDEDADIEFLCIPVQRRNTYNEHFSFIYPVNAAALASKL